MTFYLHIGMPKTGTTTIQAFLERNRDLLASRGVIVPRATGSQNHRKLTAYALDDTELDHTRRMLGLLSADKVAQFRLKLDRKLSAEAAGWPAGNSIVVSGENMSQLRQPAELMRLRDLLSPLTAGQIKVVIYLRRQDLFYLSSYSQHIKAGGTRHWSEMVGDAKKRLYDYTRFLKPWAEHFGEANIVVRPFERSQFAKQDLLSDFLSVIGLDGELSGFDIPETQNQSLDAQTAEYLRLMNPQFPRYIDDVVNLSRRELVRAMEAISTGPKLRMAPEFAHSFLSQFSGSNAEVARRYLGREDGFLFREKPDDCGESAPQLSVDQAISISAKLWAFKNPVVASGSSDAPADGDADGRG
ncbi:hypothetical protein [Hydrocarboniphaga sp.]|uniref:hypothetical protein n=1 Tax=Hydrocarboniphaga sp. TaxID=2033016 RepID=UPI003D13A2E2